MPGVTDVFKVGSSSDRALLLCYCHRALERHNGRRAAVPFKSAHLVFLSKIHFGDTKVPFPQEKLRYLNLQGFSGVARGD